MLVFLFLCMFKNDYNKKVKRNIEERKSVEDFVVISFGFII